MKNYLLVIAVSALAVFSGCRGKPLTKEQAERVAITKFQQFCSNFRVTPKDFVGPIEDGAGMGHFAFRWEDRSEDNRFTVLVMVQLDGEANVSPINHTNGWKYRQFGPPEPVRSGQTNGDPSPQLTKPNANDARRLETK